MRSLDVCLFASRSVNTQMVLRIWSILQSVTLLSWSCFLISNPGSDQTELQVLLALTVYNIMIGLTSTLCDMSRAAFSSPTCHTENNFYPLPKGRGQTHGFSPSIPSLTHLFTPTSGGRGWFPWCVSQGAPEIHKTLFTKGKITAPKIAQSCLLRPCSTGSNSPMLGTLPLCLLPKQYFSSSRSSNIL